MRWLIVFVALSASAFAASAQQSLPSVYWEWVSKKAQDWMPTISLPSLPDLTMLDFSKLAAIMQRVDRYGAQSAAFV